METTSKWIEFIPLPQEADKKTKRWVVGAKEVRLGVIRWYGSWRQYTFQPAANTIYERQCLRDIAEFCDTETTAHFQKTRSAKEAAKQLAGAST